MHRICGPWDLVLWAGNLTTGGCPEEFACVEQTFRDLQARLRSLGSDPTWLVVPGERDIVRPDERSVEARIFAKWEDHREAQDDFWQIDTSPYRRVVAQAFAAYTEWSEARPEPGVRLLRGMLPGDFSASLKKDGLRYGVVGLNSAFLQLGTGPYEGRLAVDLRQFHAACGGDGVSWTRDHDFNLLLTHRPPEWLSRASRDEFLGEIHTPGRFVAHLFGHARSLAGTALAIGGAQQRREIRGYSLFGQSTDRQASAWDHGYVAGRIAVDDAGQATLRLWPRIAIQRPGEQRKIIPDNLNFVLGDDHGTVPEVLQSTRRHVTVVGSPATATAARPFVWGRPIDNDENFLGRRQEIADIEQALAKDMPVEILGGALIGKSSLLRWFSRHPPRGLKVVLLERGAGSSPVSLVAAIAERLGEGDGQRVNDASWVHAQTLLRSFKPFTLLIDDAHRMASSNASFNDVFLSCIRGLVEQRRILWVSASDRPLHDTFMQKSVASDFLVSSQKLWLGPLDQAAADTLASGAGSYSPTILAEAGGFAHGLQWLGDRLSRSEGVDPEDILDEFREEMRPAFASWRKYLSPGQLALLRRCTAGTIPANDDERALLKSLIKRGLVIRDGTSYRLVRGTAWRRFCEE